MILHPEKFTCKEKENHLANLHFWIRCEFCRGEMRDPCQICLRCFAAVTVLANLGCPYRT